jgi:hypothetical protein
MSRSRRRAQMVLQGENGSTFTTKLLLHLVNRLKFLEVTSHSGSGLNRAEPAPCEGPRKYLLNELKSNQRKPLAGPYSAD